MNTAMSVLLYGALIWSNAVNISYGVVELVKIQRKVSLSCVSVYRTASTEGVCVLARIWPVELITEERTVVYKAIKKAHARDQLL